MVDLGIFNHLRSQPHEISNEGCDEDLKIVDVESPSLKPLENRKVVAVPLTAMNVKYLLKKNKNVQLDLAPHQPYRTSSPIVRKKS